VSSQLPVKKTAGLIEKETDEVSYEKANIEYRIMNIEGMYSIYLYKD
jgi:hypothetical protein